MKFGALLRSLWVVGDIIVLAVLVNLCFYTVSENEQVIITQFGRPVGQPIRQAGFHFKVPFIQTVNRIDKRVLEWDGRANEMPTRDKLYIVVDSFGRWQISDPLQYFTRLRDERSALSRLDDIIGSEMRNAIAKHDLIEIVRTVKDRKAAIDASPEAQTFNQLLPISIGRTAIEREVVARRRAEAEGFRLRVDRRALYAN